jgi:hypothetical protein
MAEEGESIELVIKDYTVNEIKQLQKMTEDVRDHWIKMLAEAPPTLSEAMRMAVQKSIQQAEDDLKHMQGELLDRAH